MNDRISRRRLFGMAAGAVASTSLAGMPAWARAWVAPLPSDTLASTGSSDMTPVIRLAMFLDTAPVADIAALLEQQCDVGLTMAYFDRLGIRFHWHVQDPNSTSRYRQEAGLVWWPRPGEEWLFRYWSEDKRRLLEDWLPDIEEHLIGDLQVDERLTDPGFHPIAYHLNAPGGYQDPAEAEDEEIRYIMQLLARHGAEFWYYVRPPDADEREISTTGTQLFYTVDRRFTDRTLPLLDIEREWFSRIDDYVKRRAWLEYGEPIPGRFYRIIP